MDGVSGKIAYNTRGKSIYFSSTAFKNNQNYNFTFSGYKTSKMPSLKIRVSSNANKILPFLSYSEVLTKINYGKMSANIYYHDGVFFTKAYVENLVVDYSDDIYFSSPKVNIYTTSNFVSSDKFSLSINSNEFTSRIMTQSNSSSHKFILSSTGTLDTKILNEYLDIEELAKGKTQIKSVTTYDSKQNIATYYVTSNLDCVSLNIIEPFNKSSKENKNFVFKYQHFPEIPYPTSVTLEKHKFKFRTDGDYIYTNITSPVARGFFKYPAGSQSIKLATGSFEYIDTAYFKSDGIGQSLPKIEIKSKHVKTSRAVLDDVHLIITPAENYISIDKLNFNNLYLQMQSTGKWYRNKNENRDKCCYYKQ